MELTVPGTRNLSPILEWHGWSMYDITTPPNRIEPLTWEEIPMRDQASELTFFHRYLLLPLPKENETIKEAYVNSRRDGFFPVLGIPVENREFNLGARDGYRDRAKGIDYYFLNEFYCREDAISAFSAPCVYRTHPSTVIIPMPKVVEVFSRYFAIIQFTPKGVKVQKVKKNFVN